MIDRPELTKRQSDVFQYIREYVGGNGYPPTIREIGSRFGIKSPNGVVCHLGALKKKGFIKNTPKKSRSISVIGELKKIDGQYSLDAIRRAFFQNQCWLATSPESSWASLEGFLVKGV